MPIDDRLHPLSEEGPEVWAAFAVATLLALCAAHLYRAGVIYIASLWGAG